MMHGDQAGFDALRDWLSQRCGISFQPPKADLLRQRMGRVLRRFGYADFDRLAQELRPSGREDVQLAVMHAASINHTYFFREPDVLGRFVTEFARDAAPRGDLRIWSAACSTGEEAYTIAILLAMHMGPQALGRIGILGTDISGPVVERAELGIFPARQFHQTDPAILARWFTPTGINQFAVSDALRAVCTFRRMNLKARPYPFRHPFHAIFCRNILYYFQPADQAATVSALYEMAVPGGLLVTSVTESIAHLGSGWQQIGSGLYRRPH